MATDTSTYVYACIRFVFEACGKAGNRELVTQTLYSYCILQYVKTKLSGNFASQSCYRKQALQIEQTEQLLTRYKVGAEGKSAYQRVRGKKPSNIAMPMREKVLFMPSGPKPDSDG